MTRSGPAPTPQRRPSALGGVLVRLALALQLADLATFLVAVMLAPALVSYEVGPIGLVYAMGGAVAATAFKLAGLAVVFAALAVYRGRLTTPILAGVALLGLVGAVANVHALLVARGVL
jgi:hypothetical protein